MSATMVCQRRKELKLHWIKRTKTVPQKTKFGPENKFKTSCSEFINFRFSGGKSQSQQKLEKRSLILQYSFAQKPSLNVRTSTQKPYFKNCPANMFLVGVRKHICTAPFLDAQELRSRST